jgi:ABC-type nitrate/sulfonate/bicarbonate transport system substrate-binding protein
MGYRTATGCWIGARALAITTAVIAALAGTAGAAGLQIVRFGTDWKAEAEHGGYYQAIATGIYQRYGLDVRLQQGGRRSIMRNCWPPAGSTSTSARTRSSP